MVVGAGITGVALARRLTVEGMSVLLVERGHHGSGASGRNAGFLLTGVAANYATATRQYGRPRAAEIWQFTLDNHRLLAEALQGRDTGYRRGGSWLVPASPEERDQLLESAALLREDRLPGEWREEGPASDGGPAGGLFNNLDGELDPSRAVTAIATMLPSGVLSEGRAVTAIESGAGTVRVHFDQGEVEAGRVVLATNGYTPRLVPALPVRAVRAQMLATAPVSRVITDRPVYSDFGYRYWRQLEDGCVLLGGCRNTAFDAEVGDDDSPTEPLQSRLDEHLRALGVVASVTHRWAGTMGFTPDELPLVGRVPGGGEVYVCGGYSGHGLGFAMNAVKCLVDSWGQGTIPGWLDAARFAPERERSASGDESRAAT
ncbi:MAG: NAD(P)/FAD-dependent oxidoreductase [Candidatus Dormibacteria bacterium]